MRYYKQFHNWPWAYLPALGLAGLCLGLLGVADNAEARVTAIVCALLALTAAWVLWRGRSHYLEIDQRGISHRGFRRWQVRTRDLVRVEQGRKGWSDDHDPYLRLHAAGRIYAVDSGFLINAERIGELVRAMESARASTGG